jgi:hypothetical protein
MVLPDEFVFDFAFMLLVNESPWRFSGIETGDQ